MDWHEKPEQWNWTLTASIPRLTTTPWSGFPRWAVCCKAMAWTGCGCRESSADSAGTSSTSAFSILASERDVRRWRSRLCVFRWRFMSDRTRNGLPQTSQGCGFSPTTNSHSTNRPTKIPMATINWLLNQRVYLTVDFYQNRTEREVILPSNWHFIAWVWQQWPLQIKNQPQDSIKQLRAWKNRICVLVLSHIQSFISNPLVLWSPATITEYRVHTTYIKKHFSDLLGP